VADYRDAGRRHRRWRVAVGHDRGPVDGGDNRCAAPSADTAIVFWRLAHGFFVAAEVALAVFLGALSILALRRVVLPRWLGWFGVVVTVLLLIPPIGWAALLFLLPVWLIAASLILWRRSVDE
jgi:hypothetical protein